MQPVEKGRNLRRPHFLSNANTALQFLQSKKVRDILRARVTSEWGIDSVQRLPLRRLSAGKLQCAIWPPDGSTDVATRNLKLRVVTASPGVAARSQTLCGV